MTDALDIIGLRRKESTLMSSSLADDLRELAIVPQNFELWVEKDEFGAHAVSWPKPKITIGSVMLEAYTQGDHIDQRLEAVIRHEAAHVRMNDTLSRYLLAVAVPGVLALALPLWLFGQAMLTVTLVFCGAVFSLIDSFYSRRVEFRADREAAHECPKAMLAVVEHANSIEFRAAEGKIDFLSDKSAEGLLNDAADRALAAGDQASAYLAELGLAACRRAVPECHFPKAPKFIRRLFESHPSWDDRLKAVRLQLANSTESFGPHLLG